MAAATVDGHHVADLSLARAIRFFPRFPLNRLLPPPRFRVCGRLKAPLFSLKFADQPKLRALVWPHGRIPFWEKSCNAQNLVLCVIFVLALAGKRVLGHCFFGNGCAGIVSTIPQHRPVFWNNKVGNLKSEGQSEVHR